VALLLGFDVFRNFESPYLATNIRDFWRRWHISLSSWLRDYLYIPLGGSRKGSKYLNLLLTQLLGGLWHGAHLRYLVWGLCHGVALAFTHLARDSRLRKEKAWDAIGFKSWQKPSPRFPKLKKWGGFIFTINFVSFTWILFRSDSFDKALDIASGAFQWFRPGQGAPTLVWLITLLALLGQKLGPSLKQLFLDIQSRLNPLWLSLWCAFWVIIILKLGPGGVLPFIYFQY
jgi:D-alanyl-lipoteichoic acid acyltransferase DltB (MBOAT superfamily)